MPSGQRHSRTEPARDRAGLSGPATAHGSARAILIAAAILFVGLRAFCVEVPLERDEGEYAYIAQRMLAGEVPYRDQFDQKPPGVFFVYLIPVALFGTSVAAIHVVAHLWTAATAAVLWLVARRIVDERVAAIAVLVFAVITIAPEWLATAANTEIFMLLPMTAAVACGLRGLDTGRRRWWLAAGALSMAAFWFKQVGATNVAFIAFLAAAHAWREQPRRAPAALALDAAAFAAGALLLAIPPPLYFAARGALRPFVDCVWTHNIRYAQALTLEQGWSALTSQLARQVGGFWPVWLAGAAALVRVGRSERATALTLWAWLVASAAGIFAGLFFREHYFIQLAPALALAAACGLAPLVRWAEERTPLAIRPVAATAFATVAIVPFVVVHYRFWSATPVQQARLLYGGNPFAESREIADYLAAHTRPDERIYIHGSEPQILFHARRASATRYIFIYPLMMPLPGTLERQQEAFAEVRRADPRYMILTNLYTSTFEFPDSPAYLREHITDMLRERGRLEGLRAFSGTECRMFWGPEAAQVFQAAVSQKRVGAVDLLLFRRP